MVRGFWASAAALLMCILSAAAAPCEGKSRPYRVGVIIPLSGQVASLGHYVRNGVELGLAQLDPQERSRIELVYEDDQFQPMQSVSAYRKLTAQGPLDAVFVIGSPTGKALLPLTERDGRILMAIGASDPALAVGRKYSFIHWVIPPVLGKALVAEMKRRDYKRIALVSAEVTGAVKDMEGAAAALEDEKLAQRVVYKNTFPVDQSDYRAVVARLREKQADAVVLVLFPGALAPFVKQARAARLKADLIGMETFEDEAEVKNAEGGLLGCWYVNASDPTDAFVKDYRARYNEHPGWASANGYDALRLMARAAAAFGHDNEAIRGFLASLQEYEGAAGKYSASGDNRFTLPAALKIVTAKGFERLKPSSARAE